MAATVAQPEVHIPVECDRTALVIFEHRNVRGLLRLLADGFRHCFCILEEGDHWTVCDPLKGGIVVHSVDGYGAGTLVAHFVNSSCHVAVGPASPVPTEARFALAPLTCVEFVKRAIGIREGGIWTPRQLYGHLGTCAGWSSFDPGLINAQIKTLDRTPK